MSNLPRPMNSHWAPWHNAVTVADPKILKNGVEDNLSASSSFIANAHNEIYVFYTEKWLFKKI